MTLLKAMLGAALGAALAASAVAAEIVGQAPYAGGSFGQQSDASGPGYEQAFVSSAGAVLEAIRWWGFHGPNSMGPGFDNFVVLLDGIAQSGRLSIAAASPDFDEYTLDVADALLAAATLSIINDSGDVEWFWQSSQAVGNPNGPDASRVAFSLIGRQGSATIDEPPIGALIAGALGVALLVRRSRAHAGRGAAVI